MSDEVQVQDFTKDEEETVASVESSLPVILDDTTNIWNNLCQALETLPSDESAKIKLLIQSYAKKLSDIAVECEWQTLAPLACDNPVKTNHGKLCQYQIDSLQTLKVIDWILTDHKYKAPETMTPVAQNWIAKLRSIRPMTEEEIEYAREAEEAKDEEKEKDEE